MKRRPIAAVDGDAFWLSTGETVYHGARTHSLNELLIFLRSYQVEQVWLLPSYTVLQQSLPERIAPQRDATSVPHPWVTAAADRWDIKPDGLAPWMHCIFRGERWDDFPIDVVVPQYDRRCAYWADLDAPTLLPALDHIEAYLDVRYRHSPEATGSALLMSLHRVSGGKQLREVDMPPPALAPNTERDMVWMRERTPSEKAASLVSGWDVNGMYLAACSSLRSGVGAPRHVLGSPTVRDLLAGARAGYMLSKVTYEAPPGLPNPFPEGWAWITSPTWLLAADLGAAVDTREAWVWDDTSRPLEPFYRKLRDARRVLMEQGSAQAALRTIKLMYGPLLGGRVASTRWDRSGDPLYRPDWRHFVIATARANLYRALLRLAPEDRPFAVVTDCAYFARHDADPPPGLRTGSGLGHFKSAGCKERGLVDLELQINDAPTTLTRVVS